MSGTQMSRYKVMVISSNQDFIPGEIKAAWRAVQVELIGPVAPDAAGQWHLNDAHGVLLDVNEPADVLFRISEDLDAAAIPYLFILEDPGVHRASGPFVLTAHADDIVPILSKLFETDSNIQRH